MLSLLVKSNGFTAHLLSSTYLINDVYGQLKKKIEMYVEVEKIDRNTGCNVLRKLNF